YLGAQYRRLAGRRGSKRAAMAVGHSILVAVWHMLTRGQDYADLGGNYFDERDRHLVERRLVHRLEAPGHARAPAPPARGPAAAAGGAGGGGVGADGISRAATAFFAKGGAPRGAASGSSTRRRPPPRSRRCAGSWGCPGPATTPGAAGPRRRGRPPTPPWPRP